MDWRNNQWIGLGAAGLLVVGIIITVWYIGGGGRETAIDKAGGLHFLCESCEGTFNVPLAALENEGVYDTYMVKSEEPAICKLCGDESAYRYFFCPDPACEKWYKHKMSADANDRTVCPKAHIVPWEYE